MKKRIVLWKIEYREISANDKSLPVRRYSWYALTRGGSEWGMSFDSFELALEHFNSRTYRSNGELYIKRKA